MQLNEEIKSFFIRGQIVKNEDFPCSELSDVAFIMLINVNCQQYFEIVGILTIISRINVMLN